jgi:hypothetical protein
MAPARHDPAARRRRLDRRVLTLKRRFGIASVLGFGALFGLVAQHAVGSQKHRGLRFSRQPATATRSTGSFFDSSGASYSFDDSGARQLQQAQSAAAAAPQQQPMAQSSGS